MRYLFLDEDIIIYNYKKEEEIDENYIKDIIIKIKKIYNKKISGFYNVNIYINNKYGSIIELKKDKDLDLFPDIIDLKVEIDPNSEIYLKFDDYFLIKDYKNKMYYDNNYYLNINDLKDKDNLLLSEFYTIVYGNNLNKLKDKLQLLNN